MTPKTPEEILAEFEERFKCIQSDCDGKGIIPVARLVARQVSDNDYVEDIEWEPEQCRFHAEHLDPIKSFLTESLSAYRLSVLEERGV